MKGKYAAAMIGMVFFELAAVAQGKWDQFFTNGLVNAPGEKVSPEVLNGKLVRLYFSASWCAPCKFVTPKLVAFRDRYKDSVEVVFVSQDRSEPEQLYDYDKLLASYREGKTLSKAQEEEYLRKTKARFAKEIRQANEWHEKSLKVQPLSAQPSWEELLCSFYRSEREQKSPAR